MSIFSKNKERVEPTKIVSSKGNKKTGIPNHKINVIFLNQANIEHSNHVGGVRKESEKTWIVRGHWRNQWYSSLDCHKPKWIDPHWKGSGQADAMKI